MSTSCYCLNPTCPSPENLVSAESCKTCGSLLTLGDSYRALSLLGQGRAGLSWFGYDVTSTEQIRCVIQQEALLSTDVFEASRAIPNLQSQGLQYAQRLAQLGYHPQIPLLLDAIQRSVHWYFVWEFVEGTPLSTRLAQGNPFSESQVRQLLRSLLPVLQVIHDCGIIHRDLKPKNIIMTRQGPWIVDFKSALLADGTTPEISTPVGDAEYAAPEQILGQPTYASDLYSLGLMCVQLLTLVSPFELYSIPEAQAWQAYLPEPLSPGLAQILTKLLRPAHQRYRTATAVLADLADLVALPTVPTTAVLPQQQDAPNGSAWSCRHTLTDHRGAVTAIAANDAVIISGGSDRTIRIWTWQGQCQQVIQNSLWFGEGHRDRISALKISRDGLTLFSSSDDGTLCEWSLPNHSRQALLVSPGWGISAFATLPGLLVSGGTTGALQLWDLENGVIIESWQQHRAQISGLAISPNQQVLLSSSYDGTVRFWDLATANLIDLVEVGRPVTAMTVMPHWDILVTGDDRGYLQLWDIVDMVLVHSAAAHRGAVTALSSSPQQFASGGDDAQIHLWGLPEAQDELLECQLLRQPQSLTRLISLSHDWSINAIAFSPDGTRFASGSADETLRLWQRHV